jgi:uncharacterized membrane protein
MLVIGMVVIAGLLVAVVTDASALYLKRRALQAMADAAAIAGAQAIDGDAVYAGKATDAVPLDPAGVSRAVRLYLDDAQGTTSFPVGLSSVSTDGVTARVELSASIRLPFPVPGSKQTALTIRASSAATTPLSAATP